MKKEIMLDKEIIDNSFNSFFSQLKQDKLYKPSEIFNLPCEKCPQFFLAFSYYHYHCQAFVTTIDAQIKAHDKLGLINSVLSEELTNKLQHSLYLTMGQRYGNKFVEHLQKQWHEYFKTKYFCEDLSELDLSDISFKQEEKNSELDNLKQMLIALS